MALNYWHFIMFFFSLVLMAGGIYFSLSQESKKIRIAMQSIVVVLSILFGVFSIVIVDKYTKKVKLSKLQNKRLLSTEKIVYKGIVSNVGNHKIGKVIFEIKLVNRGHVVGTAKTPSMYQSSGILDFLFPAMNVRFKPQSITKEFVVAKNLKPGQSKSFRVYFPFPPYFRSVAQFTKVYGK